jgi:hypothetical protein
VDAYPAGAAERLRHIGGPFVGEVCGVNLDRRRVLREDCGPERPRGFCRFAGQNLPSAVAGASGTQLSDLGVAGPFQLIRSLTLSDDV